MRIPLFLLLAFLSSAAWPDLPRAELRAGLFRIDAEVAATHDARMQGLMFRREMAVNQGMLFVFTQPGRQCMWMKNTFLPLSVAFLDDEGRILNIADMTPHSETAHCAAGAARYALEMNAGWFAARRLAPGIRINGLERAPRPQ